MFSRIIFITILFQLYCNFIFPQQPDNFNNINSEQGLPSSECYYVMQDSKGYIWISTNKGVVKYNGKLMKVFTIDDGLTDNVVFSTYEDKKGRIWFRTSNGNICYYLKDSIYKIKANAALVSILNKRIISRFYMDERDNLWLSAYGIADIVMIPSKNNYKNVELIKKNKYELHCEVFNTGECLFSGANNSGPENRLLNLKYSKGFKKIQLSGLYLSLFNSMTSFNDSDLVLSSARNYIIYIKDRELKRLFYNNRVIDVFKENENSLWVSVYKGGVYKYLLNNLSKPVYHFFDGYTVTSVIKDYEGGSWFSTLENGIYYKRNLENNLYEYPGHESSTTIRFLKKENNFLFLGTDKPSLVAIDSVLNPHLMNLGKFTPGYNINSIEYFSSGYYLSGYGSLKCFDSSLHYKNEMPTVRDSKLPSGGPGINSTFKQIKFIDKDKFILNDGYNVSLSENLKIDKKINLPIRVNLFGYDSLKRTTYIGTKKGLYKTNNFITASSIEPGTFKEAVIVSIMNYQNDKHLFATQQNGLFLENSDKYGLVFYKKNVLINDIATDEHKNIWVATNNGIVFLKKEGEGFRTNYLGKSDGLQSNEVNQIVCFKNMIWYTTNSGLYYFEPGKLLIKPIPPKLEIEELKVNNMVIPLGLVSELKYYQNNLTVKAKCLSFLPGGPTGLIYRLTGYDTTWHSTGSENIINYTNLPAGDYQLQIKGINSKGILSKESKVFDFKIPSPFWLTLWFITIEIVTLLGIIFALVTFYVSKIRKKEKRKTEVNRLLAQYQMTALRSQINPHFIFNCISSIQALMLKEQTETAYEYLQKFSKLLRLVLENSEKNIINLKEELQVLNLYVQLEQLRFDGSFNYCENIGAGVDISVIKVPYMILQPIVENAIWHGLLHSSKKEKKLNLNIKTSQEKIQIEIIDNGIGRKKSKQYGEKNTKRSLGQNITSERLKIMNSESVKATSFEIFDLYDQENNPLGTCVKIELPITSKQ